MSDVTLGSVPFQDAIDHLRNKVKIPTERWDQMTGQINARAFTVAGATKTALLDDLYNAILKARTEGTTITEFRKAFDKMVQDNGWTYKGKRGWRTRVIYDTNMRTSSMAGRWAQFQRVKDTRPFLQYLTVGDARVRPEHAEWDRKVLHMDDDWWATHYPPNGWGCRCTVRSLSLRQMRREGLEVDQAPPLQVSERISPATGEIQGEVPRGIDVGWDYNVGKAWLGPDTAFGEDLVKLAPSIRGAALKSAQRLAPKLATAWRAWIDENNDDIAGVDVVRTVGYLPEKVIGTLQRRGTPTSTALITAEAELVRGTNVDLIEDLPTRLSAPQLIYIERDSGHLIYDLNDSSEDRPRVSVRIVPAPKRWIVDQVISDSDLDLSDQSRYR